MAGHPPLFPQISVLCVESVSVQPGFASPRGGLQTGWKWLEEKVVPGRVLRLRKPVRGRQRKTPPSMSPRVSFIQVFDSRWCPMVAGLSKNLHQLQGSSHPAQVKNSRHAMSKSGKKKARS
eukprot:EG_transcript_33812